MKKLVIAVSVAVAALFSFGAGSEFEESGTSFEYTGQVVGQNLDTAKDDNGVDANERYWYSTSNDGLVITNYDGTASASVPSGVSRPDKFASADNYKYLTLDTSTKLYRSVTDNSQDGAFTGVTVPDSGIYLDTLVQFTAADAAFSANLDAGEKIAISYVEHGEDALETEGEATYTNFVIRAGYITGQQSVVQTNYFAAVPANFDKTAWHRLTVRAVDDIDADEHLGFVVYLDQVALELADSTVEIGDNFTATGVAQNFYSATKRALFPSAIVTGGSLKTISAAAFTGMGAIDDIVFTKSVPNFIKESEAVPATITLDTGIASITVTVGEKEYQPRDSTATPLVYNLPAGTTSFNIEVTPDVANGYGFDGLDGATYTAGVVTWTGAAPTFTVLSYRNNFLVGANETPYKTLSAALAASTTVAGDTIKLAYSYNVAAEGASFETYAINKSVTLDLNGNTLNGGSGQEESALFELGRGVQFTVIDSSSANTGKIIYNNEYGIFYADGAGTDCYVGAASGDYGPIIDGIPVAEDSSVWIVRAKVIAEGNTDSGAFKWSESLGDDSSAELNQAGTYWVVEPEGSVEPAKYALTLPTVTGATAVVTTNGVALSSAEMAEIPAGTVVTVTWTAGSGYKITAGATETITMSAAQTATAPTVVAVYAIDYTGATHATVVTDPADTSALEAGATVAFTVTPESTYTYEGVTLADGWERNSETGVLTYTLTVSGAATVAIPDAVSAGGKTYPTYIGDDATKKGKYDAWAEYASISVADFPDAQGTNEEAYLLNCLPADVAAAKAAFKFTKIEKNTSGEWVTETTMANPAGRAYNGTVTTSRYSDPACTTAAAEGNFFRATLH